MRLESVCFVVAAMICGLTAVPAQETMSKQQSLSTEVRKYVLKSPIRLIHVCVIDDTGAASRTEQTVEITAGKIAYSARPPQAMFPMERPLWT